MRQNWNSAWRALLNLDVLHSNFVQLKSGFRRPGQRAAGDADYQDLVILFAKLLDVSVRSSLHKYHAMIGDISERLGKKATLRISGDDLKMNRDKVHILQEAIVHLIRNAIDHGIETVEERRTVLKPYRGVIEIECCVTADMAGIIIRDDGRGMDAEAIYKIAKDLNVLPPTTEGVLSHEQKLRLIMVPGLSTAKVASEISGRGVGMDIVKKNIDRLGGKIEIHTQLGKGSEISLSWPMDNDEAIKKMVIAEV